MSKILLKTEFKDSLGEEEFNVKIVQHSGNPVLGDKVEVKILHPEENFIEVYDPAEFPEQFFADLQFRGWSFVLEEIMERLEKEQYYIFINCSSPNPEGLKICKKQEGYSLSCYDRGFFDTKEEAETVKKEMIQEALDEIYQKGGETPYWKEFHNSQKKEEFRIATYPEPEFFKEYGYTGFDPYPEYSGSKYWHIKKL